jgi:hypothetical protein
VHRQFLLELFDLLLVLPHQLHRVLLYVDCGFTSDAHHAQRKLQSRYGFVHLRLLCPDVGDHSRFAVASKRVAQEIGEFALTEGNVFSRLVSQRQHNLL